VSEVKQVIVIRRDLRMRRGKEIAQGAHAAMAFLTRRMSFGTFGHPGLTAAAFTAAEREWITGSFAKIVCRVDSLKELEDVAKGARDAGLHVEIITDSGRTEFHGALTITCLAIGPDYAEKIDPVTGGLELY
jgi:PTH2 family peptidyl-tRNA hydrolase